MNSGCPELLTVLCELSGRFPTPSNEQIATFLAGVMVVVFFAVDHYKIPTYARTTIGEFIELAPESLTSAARYRRGLYTYVALMIAFYLIILMLGASAVGPVLSFLSPKLKSDADQTLWPLAAASIVTLIGTANDKNLGRLEAWLRSIAHEAAYIPEAVTNLANALDGSFTLTETVLRELGDASPENLKVIQENQEGSLQTWMRANYLFSRLEILKNRDDEFRELLRQPENERAFNFLDAEHESLAGRIGRARKHPEVDDALIKKVETFKNAAAVFLASLLWRGSGTEAGIKTKLSKLKLDITSAERRSSWTFMLHVLACLSIACGVLMLLLEFLGRQSSDSFTNERWYLTLSLLVLLLTAFLVNRWRENRLESGEWRNSYDHILRSTLLCGTAVGVAAALITFVIHEGGRARFQAMLLIGVILALASAALYHALMRSAASAPPTSAIGGGGSGSSSIGELAWSVVRPTIVFSSVTFVLVSCLYWMGQLWVVTGSPLQILDLAQPEVANIEKAYKDRGEHDLWFVNVVPQHLPRDLGNSLGEMKAAVRNKAVDQTGIDKIHAKCQAISNAFYLSADKLFHEKCEINEKFTVLIPLASGVRESAIKLHQLMDNLIANLSVLAKYDSMWSAIRDRWPRAVLAAGICAVMSGMFACAVILYRRQMLWDGVTSRRLSDLRPYLQEEPTLWLRQPIHEVNNLTPLEALRYRSLRSKLSDFLSARKSETELRTSGGAPDLRVVAAG